MVFVPERTTRISLFTDKALPERRDVALFGRPPFGSGPANRCGLGDAGDNGGSLAPDGDASSPMLDSRNSRRDSSFCFLFVECVLLLLRHTTKNFR